MLNFHQSLPCSICLLIIKCPKPPLHQMSWTLKSMNKLALNEPAINVCVDDWTAERVIIMDQLRNLQPNFEWSSKQQIISDIYVSSVKCSTLTWTFSQARRQKESIDCFRFSCRCCEFSNKYSLLSIITHLGGLSICTDTNSQYYFVHRYPNNVWYNQAYSLTETPYFTIIASKNNLVPLRKNYNLDYIADGKKYNSVNVKKKFVVFLKMVLVNYWVRLFETKTSILYFWVLTWVATKDRQAELRYCLPFWNKLGVSVVIYDSILLVTTAWMLHSNHSIS